MEIIKINTPYIKLDQLLKYAGIVDSGGIAKEIILSGQVILNGQVVIERGKKIYPGYELIIKNNQQTISLKIE